MTALGYALISEEHSAIDLLHNAVHAEEAGFSFATVSDHFHPWLDVQGESPFVWSVLGAIAASTDSLVIGTGVTCPIMRIHPAIIAQAAATMATLAPDRFFLGVGTGENLNEHVLGNYWPPIDTRLRMLEEAIAIIRALWEGEEWSYDGEFFTVDHARIYSRPETPPPVFVASSGIQSAMLAGAASDGLIVTSPDEDVVEAWRSAGGIGPRMGMLHLVYHENKGKAREILAKHWAHAPLPGFMNVDLRRPAEFEAASKFLRLDDYSDQTPLGPDPGKVIEAIRAFERVGVDHVLLHQIGPEQEGFFRFIEDEVAPELDVSPAQLIAP